MQDYSGKWKAERERAAFLALADGTVFHGVAFGAAVDQVGEVVFNTGMSGYQEILTDPSYAGQIVTLTAAEVGNYGTNPEDVESRGLFLHGLVVNDLNAASNYRSTQSLDSYLRAAGVPGLYGVETRALTLHLRDNGNQKAYLHVAGDALTEAEAVARARAWEGLDGQDYAAKVTCSAPYEYAPCGENRPRVVCYDFGVKTNILRSLAAFARRRHLRNRQHPRASGIQPPRPTPHFRHLPRTPVAVTRLWGEDGAAPVRAPRLQPSREEPCHGERGDHEPEPQFRGVARFGSRLPGSDACEPQRWFH